jgi:hypothetical protein
VELPQRSVFVRMAARRRRRPRPPRATRRPAGTPTPPTDGYSVLPSTR